LQEQGRYLWRKLAKLYPLYFFTTMYTFLYYDLSELTALTALSTFPKQLVRNLLLIQAWFSEGYFSYNGVGWFLSALLFLSLFNLPVIYLLNKINRRPKGRVLLLGGLGAVLFLTAVYCYLTRNLDLDYWQYIFPPARLGEYLSGMLLGILLRSLKPYLKPGKGMRLVFTALEIAALCCWFVMLSHPGGSWRSRIFTWLLPNVCLLSVFTCGMGGISSLFRWKPLVRLGDVSFECYLLHYVIVMQYTLSHGDQEFSGMGKTAVFLYCLGLTLLLAFLIHRWPGKKRSSDANEG
ncbi:MAG: acyltransferase family protein, partial [Faecousia sp.]